MIKKFLFWCGLFVIFAAGWTAYSFFKSYSSLGNPKILVVNLLKVRENHPFIPLMHNLFQKMQSLGMVRNYNPKVMPSTLNTNLQKVKLAYLQGIQEDYHQEVKGLMEDLQEKERLLGLQKEKELKSIVNEKRNELEQEQQKTLQPEKEKIKAEKIKEKKKIKENFAKEKFKLELKLKTLISLTEEEKKELQNKLNKLEEEFKINIVNNEKKYKKKYAEIVKIKEQNLEDNIKQYQQEIAKQYQQELDQEVAKVETELKNKILAKKANLQNSGDEANTYLNNMGKLKFPSSGNKSGSSLKKVMDKLNKQIISLKKVILNETNNITISIAREKGNTVLLNSYIVNINAEDITQEAIKKVKKLN